VLISNCRAVVRHCVIESITRTPHNASSVSPPEPQSGVITDIHVVDSSNEVRGRGSRVLEGSTSVCGHCCGDGKHLTQPVVPRVGVAPAIKRTPVLCVCVCVCEGEGVGG